MSEAGFELDAVRGRGPSAAAERPPVTLARRSRRARRPRAAGSSDGAGPDVVLGGGGVRRRARWCSPRRRCGIPAALTEADAHLGLANRLAAPFARRVFLAYPLAGRDGEKYRVVGRPIPRALPSSRRRRGGGAGAVRPPGGGAGGPRLRGEPRRAAPQRGRDRGVRRAETAGRPSCTSPASATTPTLAPRVSPARLPPARRSRTTSAPRSRPPTSSSPAPAASVWEIAAAGRPALLVPYPYATADHQTKNARWFERGGGAVVVPEPELDLGRQAGELLADPAGSREWGRRCGALARPDAADRIAEELIALAAARR